MTYLGCCFRAFTCFNDSVHLPLKVPWVVLLCASVLISAAIKEV